jgi:hypothetical protein
MFTMHSSPRFYVNEIFLAGSVYKKIISHHLHFPAIYTFSVKSLEKCKRGVSLYVHFQFWAFISVEPNLQVMEAETACYLVHMTFGM